MSPGAPSRMIAAIVALAAFAVAVAAGLAAGNPAPRVLTVAIVSLIICYALGSVAGAIGEWVITEHVRDAVRAKTPEDRTKSAPT